MVRYMYLHNMSSITPAAVWVPNTATTVEAQRTNLFLQMRPSRAIISCIIQFHRFFCMILVLHRSLVCSCKCVSQICRLTDLQTKLLFFFTPVEICMKALFLNPKRQKKIKSPINDETERKAACETYHHTRSSPISLSRRYRTRVPSALSRVPSRCPSSSGKRRVLCALARPKLVEN